MFKSVGKAVQELLNQFSPLRESADISRNQVDSALSSSTRNVERITSTSFLYSDKALSERICASKEQCTGRTIRSPVPIYTCDSTISSSKDSVHSNIRLDTLDAAKLRSFKGEQEEQIKVHNQNKEHLYKYSEIRQFDYVAMRDLQGSKVRLNCTRVATKVVSYLLSNDTKDLKLTILESIQDSTRKAQTTDDVKKILQDSAMIKSLNKSVTTKYRGGVNQLSNIEKDLLASPNGTIAVLFGSLILKGTTGTNSTFIGHALVAYHDTGRIKYFDATSPERFCLSTQQPKKYFNPQTGVYSQTLKQEVVWHSQLLFKSIFII